MEDFGFRLQNIKNTSWFKKAIKIGLVIFAVLISTILLIKLIKITVDGGSSRVENVSLIKSQVKSIKRLPETEGGLVVDNLDVSVYDVINSNEKENINPVVKKTRQDINLKETLNDGMLEQDLLAQKMNEINESDEINVEQSKNIKTEKMKANSQKPVKTIKSNDYKQKSTANIRINNNEKKSSTNVNDLKKLGNNSLISNLKKKKDIKPGVRVQLLALKSKDSLIEYWEELRDKYINLFNDKNYYIEKVNLDRSGTIYRLQVGNFMDRKSAAEFCKEYTTLTNKTKLDCIIVKN